MRPGRVAAVAAAIALAVYGLVAGIAYPIQTAAHDAAQARNEVWTVVAGEGTPQGFSPADDLARALARDIDTIEVAGDFVAPPNAYRGVTEEIGQNPFDERGRNCTECGPLTQEFFEDLQTVRDGGLEEVLVDTAAPDGSLTGAGLGVEIPGVALVAAGTAAVLASRREQERSSRLRRRLGAMGLAGVHADLIAELETLEVLPADQAADDRVTSRIQLLTSMVGDIEAAAAAESIGAESAGIDAAVEHHLASSDPVVQRANDALLARRQALRELP